MGEGTVEFSREQQVRTFRAIAENLRGRAEVFEAKAAALEADLRAGFLEEGKLTSGDEVK